MVISPRVPETAAKIHPSHSRAVDPAIQRPAHPGHACDSGSLLPAKGVGREGAGSTEKSSTGQPRYQLGTDPTEVTLRLEFAPRLSVTEPQTYQILRLSDGATNAVYNRGRNQWCQPVRNARHGGTRDDHRLGTGRDKPLGRLTDKLVLCTFAQIILCRRELDCFAGNHSFQQTGAPHQIEIQP